MDDKSSQEPSLKKAKKEDALTKDPTQWYSTQLAALESKHAAEKNSLEARHEREKEELKDKYLEMHKKVKVEALREKAGTKDAKDVCGTCGAAIDIKEDEDEDLEDYFCCDKCQLYHCNQHKEEMTTCIVCGCSYCDDCLESIDKCHGCGLCPQLTCCDLEKMPCGEYECSPADCNYYHHKHCKCQSSRYY
jgi:hypothetical protein